MDQSLGLGKSGKNSEDLQVTETQILRELYQSQRENGPVYEPVPRRHLVVQIWPIKCQS